MIGSWFQGLDNGIDFNISTFDRYPNFAELLMTLPDERPEEFEEYHERPFLTRGDAEWMFRRAVAREPLELIAYVVMNDRPYTESSHCRLHNGQCFQ